MGLLRDISTCVRNSKLTVDAKQRQAMNNEKVVLNNHAYERHPS